MYMSHSITIQSRLELCEAKIEIISLAVVNAMRGIED